MDEGPRETVTFLCTTLDSRSPSGAPAAEATERRRYMTLLRRAVTAHGGEVLHGDATRLDVQFATALAALSAALDAQQSGLAAPALSDAQVQMCMALDTVPVAAPAGTPAPGPALTRVTRLLLVAHPGQVLLTADTQAALGEGLPQGVMLRDLGEYHLRDIIRPVHVFQLVTLDLPAEFPPLPALAHHPTNVRLPPIPLIGRAAERAATAALLQREGVRLVTLTGPGGTGKTHLALQVATDVLDHFTHGVLLVSLAALRDPALVIPAIAETLGIKEEAGQPLLDTLQYALRDQQLLLVLDNFEQVLAAGPQVRRLLATTFRVRVLATSRTPLGVYGEHEFPVTPLQVPDVIRLPPLPTLAAVPAVTLFTHYARLADPHFAVTPQNAAIVATLCARLDGLPLALRLAAAQIKHHTPPDILARLPQRLTFHNGTLETLPPLPARQQTLQDTITWSYDLLTPAEQALFRRLAVFSGPFAAASVAAVAGDGSWGLGSGVLPDPRAGDPPPLSTQLSALVEKSLLQRLPDVEGEPRFYMLETIREYALERLRAAGEADRLYRRHAETYVALAEQAEPELRGSGQVEWLARLERVHGNLRAADAWLRRQSDWESAGRLAGALRLFWVTHSYLTEGRQRLETVLTHAEELTPPVRAKVFHSAGVLAWTQGDNDAARRYFEEALALRRAAGDRGGTAILLNNLGHLAILRGAYDEGEPLLNEAFALQEVIGDGWGSAHTLSNLGNVAMLRGDYPQAIALMEESLARRRTLGDTHGIADSLSSLGDVLLLQGDSARADAIFRECLETFQTLGDQSGMADCFQGLAETAALQGRAVRAARLAGAAEALREAIGGHDWPHLAVYHERVMAAVRAQLPEAAWSAAWAAGRALPLARAVAYAREITS
jgi:predicted ATPase